MPRVSRKDHYHFADTSENSMAFCGIIADSLLWCAFVEAMEQPWLLYGSDDSDCLNHLLDIWDGTGGCQYTASPASLLGQAGTEEQTLSTIQEESVHDSSGVHEPSPTQPQEWSASQQAHPQRQGQRTQPQEWSASSQASPGQPVSSSQERPASRQADQEELSDPVYPRATWNLKHGAHVLFIGPRNIREKHSLPLGCVTLSLIHI